MDIVDQLQALGVEEKQAKVYLAALELGRSTIQELAHKSGVKRTSIYNFLDELKEKQLLVEVREGKNTLFLPADPHTILGKAKSQLKVSEQILPELLSLFNVPGDKPKVRYYEGSEGVIEAYKDILDSGETIYAYSDFEKISTTMDTELMWQFPIERARRGIKFYGIAKAGPWGEYTHARDVEQLRELKFVKDVDFETEINIYGNKAAMISFRRPYASVIVEDRAIVQTLRSTWKLLWDSLPIPADVDKAKYLKYPTITTDNSPSAGRVPTQSGQRRGKKSINVQNFWRGK